MSAENPPSNLPVPIGPENNVESHENKVSSEIEVTQVRNEKEVPHEEEISGTDIIDAEFIPINTEADQVAEEKRLAEEAAEVERVKGNLARIAQGKELVPVVHVIPEEEFIPAQRVELESIINLGNQSEAEGVEYRSKKHRSKEAPEQGPRKTETDPGHPKSKESGEKDLTNHEEEKKHKKHKKDKHKKEGHDDHKKHEHNHDGDHNHKGGHTHEHGHHGMSTREKIIATGLGIAAAATIVAEPIQVMNLLHLTPLVAQSLAGIGVGGGLIGLGAMWLGSVATLSLIGNFLKAVWEERGKLFSLIPGLGGGGGGGGKKAPKPAGGGGGHAGGH